MSSHGIKFNTPLPALGVRRDIDDIVQSPEMLEYGINVVTSGGTVRPRCAHTREGFGQTATDWKALLACSGVAVMDGLIIAYNAEGANWYSSVNLGTAWAAAAVAGSIVDKTVTRIFGFKDQTPENVLWAWCSDGSIHRAALGAFAGVITFSQLSSQQAMYVPVKRQVQSPQQSDPVFYDPGTGAGDDALWWQALGDGSNPLCRVDVVSDVTDSASFTSNYRNCGSAGDHAGTPLVDMDVAHWPSSDWKLIGAGYMETGLGRLSCGVIVNRSNPKDVRAIDKIPLTGDYSPFSVTYYFGARSNALQARLIPDNTLELLCVDRLISVDLETMTETALSPVYSDNSFIGYSWADADSVSPIGDVNIRSDDNCATWDTFEGMPATLRDAVRIHSVSSGGRGAYFLEALGILWKVPGFNIATNPANEKVCGIFQATADLEDHAFFSGTETRMLHLDRLSESWENITNTTPSGGGNGAGAQPAGTFGTNPWVFRGFAMGSYRYMVCCNGQVQPQCWRSDYSTLRMLGDPNFDDVIEEAVPPVAHCMAVANNRLILGSRPHNIRFSRPSNFDIGYDEFEVNLRDTEGELVGMWEIGANQIVAFKTDAVYHGQSQAAFMGTSAPMNFSRNRQGIVGPCSPHSVSYLPDGRILYLARDGGLYIYDAVAPVDAGRHIRALIRDEIDPDKYGLAWTMIDTARSLAYIFYPLRDVGKTVGLIAAMDMGTPWPIWQMSLPPTWNLVAGMNAYFKRGAMLGSFISPRLRLSSFPGATLGSFTEGGQYQMVVARQDNTWYRQHWEPHEGEYSDAGLAIDCAWSPGWIAPDPDMSAYSQLHELHHVAKLNGNTISVRALAEQFSGAVETSAWQAIAEGNERLKTTYRMSGRRFKFQFQSFADAIFNYAHATAIELPRGTK